MNIKNKIGIAVLVLTLAVAAVPFSASAQTASIASLQSQLQSLLQQVAQLRGSNGGGGFRGMGNFNPGGPNISANRNGVFGTVSAINGTSLTVTSNANSNGGTATTYTVDASNATITKSGQSSSVANIAVGDNVMIQGTISGTNVTATAIRDGVGAGQGPAVIGTVTAISGDSLTVQSTATGQNSTQTTYTVDATNATVTKAGASSTVSAIAVGDTIAVQGTVSGTNVTATAIRDGVSGQMFNGQNGVFGTVASISGDTITVTGRTPQNGTATTYTVDATNATVTKAGASSTVSNIAVGDTIMVQGTVSGTNVTATSIRDGVPQNTIGNGQNLVQQIKQRLINNSAPKQSISIDANGKTTIRGTLSSVSGNTITIQSWGVTFTVDTTNAKFVGNATSLSSFQTGDMIGVQATLASGSSTISASVVRDWSVAATTGQ